jgi:hypothetical protein
LLVNRFQDLQIEPPTQKQVERLISSAIYQHELLFCNQTLSQINSTNIEQIDILLTPEETPNIEKPESEKLPVKIKASDLAFLKTDPGPVGLGSFLTEIEKLKRIRAVGSSETGQCHKCIS